MKPLIHACQSIAALRYQSLSMIDCLRECMRIVQSLVPCDTINIGTVDLQSEEGFHFDLEGFLMPSDRRDILPHFKHQHPMLEYARRFGINPPLRFTDLSTRRQFEETGIYQECYRGYTHSMITFGIDAPPDINISMVLSRGQGEFSDKDREILELLQPVVSTTFQCLFLKNTLNRVQDAAQAPGVIVGSGPYIINCNPPAVSLLKEFAPQFSLTRLPESLYQIIRKAKTQITTVTNPEGIALSVCCEPSIHCWTLKIWKTAAPFDAKKLAQRGLTQRQIEILQWVARGKTNAEIALILAISYRTVQKHLENIFRILGVENRMAAVSYCREPHLID
ncbi:MAG: helix-turn-helix transcriptional regulator [Oceanipulchritudo sp.]